MISLRRQSDSKKKDLEDLKDFSPKATQEQRKEQRNIKTLRL